MAGTNAQLAATFEQMADILEILGGDGFRVNAFKKVGRVLSDLPAELTAADADVKKLVQIEGVGQGAAGRIAEFLRSGKIKEHQELLAKVPRGLPALFEIPGLGPKTVALLWKQAGVESVEVLKVKLAGQELAALPGMGPKKIENLRKNLAFAETAGQRFRIGQAMPLAAGYVEKLGALPGVKQVQYAGSLRRGQETIGDLDLLVAAEAQDAAAIGDAFVQLEPVEQVLAHGPTKSAIRTAEGVQVDLRIVVPESYGAALMYFTGSKGHNVALRQRAIDRGLKLSEYGLFREGKEQTLVAGATEQQVYQALGLDWIAPELREDRNEIELAAEHKLPQLIELDDIRAELHAHTTASDGRWSIRELAGVALAHGYHTVAVTDHSVSEPIANGLTPERLEAHIRAVRDVALEMEDRIAVLAGSEVDILADGTLDYPNSLLRELDIVVASPHSALGQDPAKATARLLQAIHNPYVTILGHPTGRLVGKREGLAPDMRQVVAAAKERGIALEINANAYRLDLRDTHARLAVEAGVKLAIDTDAHAPGDLDHLRYGVLTARRAGATAGDVVNTLSRAALAQWIKGTRM